MVTLEYGTIKSLGVGTNYGVKYGKVKAISYRGVEGSSLVISYDDETSETMEVEPEVIVKKSGRTTTLSTLQVGDYVRVLYNRGIISPNNVYETIKQIKLKVLEKENELSVESMFTFTAGIVEYKLPWTDDEFYKKAEYAINEAKKKGNNQLIIIR